MRVIDISNWQKSLNLLSLQGEIDAVIVKGTEGINYVNPSCDKHIQQAVSMNIPFGFYHFARNNDPIVEADYFIKHCKGYFNKGIPILDWEVGQSVEWVNKFVGRIKEQTGVNPWIYANPWRFNQGHVDYECARWVAGYPKGITNNFNNIPKIPYTVDGLVACWQFTSSGRLNGYNENLDLNIFYGGSNAWAKYANTELSTENNPDVSLQYSGGKYQIVAKKGVNIRSTPSIKSNEPVDKYKYGEPVYLDNKFTINDGYVWGTYIGYSGNRRYIAIESTDGKEILVKKV